MLGKQLAAAFVTIVALLAMFTGCVNPADKVRIGTDGERETYYACGETLGKRYRKIYHSYG